MSRFDLPDQPWENPGDDLEYDPGVEAYLERTRAAYAAGEKAFAEGVPVEKAPRQDFEQWRTGWFTARNAKMHAFEEYIKMRTLFEKQYAPPGRHGMLGEMQAIRQKVMDRHVERYPDIPAAWDRRAKALSS